MKDLNEMSAGELKIALLAAIKRRDRATQEEIKAIALARTATHIANGTDTPELVRKATKLAMTK